MPIPRYEYIPTTLFGGIKPDACSFEEARAVVLPVPLELTTSYVPGTRNGPREILLASTHMEMWDEETGTDGYSLGVVTLPEMELPFGDTAGAVAEIARVTSELAATGKYLVVLGGEHSLTPGVVAGLAGHTAGLSVLQFDAHADLRESYMENPFSHASAIRRTLEHVPCTQVGIRSLSREEAVALPGLRTRIFFDFEMRQDPDWMDRVVDTLTDKVYITIDVDGFDPSIMPATGTPEPGGLGWHEALTLLRKVFSRREVVGADLVELCPMPGNVAPTFLCARLLFKLLAYKFRAAPASRQPPTATG